MSQVHNFRVWLGEVCWETLFMLLLREGAKKYQLYLKVDIKCAFMYKEFVYS